MPQDLLQIALEHHRNGRLRQAESGYRALLGIDPQNAEAAHWLGVLIFQAGRADEAVPLLERATEAKPEDAAFWHNLGQAYLSTGRADDAIAAFDRAVAINPSGPEPLVSAATARLGRRTGGDLEAAIDLLGKARASGVNTAEVDEKLGLALLLSGRPDDAITSLVAALEKSSNNPDIYYQLGTAHLQKQDPDGARLCLRHAMALKPDHALACFALASLEMQCGNLPEAESLFRNAITLKPDSPAAHQGLATVLTRLGRKKDAKLALADAQIARNTTPRQQSPRPASAAAIAELERKLTRSPAAEQLQFALALKANLPPPAKHPGEVITNLFDKYAPKFDEHLVDKLDYRVPERIAEAVAALDRPAQMDILDLGCGTGLCGALLRPMAATLTGIDMSAAMVQKSSERGVYDRLVQGDIVEAMRDLAASFNLLVAADVLIYVGELAPTFEAATSVLRPGGWFVFSVEHTDGDRYKMNTKHHRYSHSHPYVQRLASMYGFIEEAFNPIVIRQEAGQPVPGHLAVLRYQP